MIVNYLVGRKSELLLQRVFVYEPNRTKNDRLAPTRFLGKVNDGIILSVGRFDAPIGQDLDRGDAIEVVVLSQSRRDAFEVHLVTFLKVDRTYIVRYVDRMKDHAPPLIMAER